MTLRRRFALYLVVVHLAAATLAVAWLHARGAWLLLAEVLLVCSLAAGFLLLRRMFGAFSFTSEASQLLADGDFMSRFRPVGQPELDRLIELYNRMSDRLRGERVRLEEQQQFLTRIMAVSPLGIVLLGFDGEVAYVNPAGERLLQQPASHAAREAARRGSRRARRNARPPGRRRVDGGAAVGRPARTLPAGLPSSTGGFPVPSWSSRS